MSESRVGNDMEMSLEAVLDALEASVARLSLKPSPAKPLVKKRPAKKKAAKKKAKKKSAVKPEVQKPVSQPEPKPASRTRPALGRTLGQLRRPTP